MKATEDRDIRRPNGDSHAYGRSQCGDPRRRPIDTADQYSLPAA